MNYMRVTAKQKRKFLCFFFHSWEVQLQKSTRKTRYSKCLRCDMRKIEQFSEGYQPIDWEFLDLEKKQ